MSGPINTVKRLTELTTEMKAAIPAHVEEWTRRGLSTERADWDTFERAAADCYRFAGLEWHGNVVRVASPLTVAFAAPIAAHLLADLAIGSAVDSAVGSAVGSAVDSAVYSAVDSAVGSAVYSAVGSAVDSAVYSAVDSAVGSAVSSAVGSAVSSAVSSAVDSAVSSGWTSYFGGSWWAWWPAVTAFYRDVCGLTLDDDLWDKARAYEDAQMSVGWWWPHTHFVVVSDRPTELHRDPVGRLHSDTGPSIAWGDEWALHHWHGREVPDWVIVNPTVEAIRAEPNVEIRRCAIEHLGWDRWIDAAGLRPLAECDDPGNPGQTLALYSLDGDPDTRILLATNGTTERDGTRRRYGLGVPSTCRTPIDAAAWTYDISPDHYQQLQRRT